MQIALYVLGIFATVALGVAGFLVSLHDDHKISAIWILFIALVLYAFTFCLYLHNTYRETRQPPKSNIHEVESPASSTTPTPSPTSTVEQPKTSQGDKSAEYRPDETAIKIIAFLAKPQHSNVHVVEIGTSLRLDQTLVDRYIDQLTKEDYVKVTPTGRFHNPVCNLTPKGREFAVQNKLLEQKPKESSAQIASPSPPTPQEKPKLKSEFTVLWDDNKVSHCPVCSNLLSYTSIESPYGERLWGFHCVQCKDFIYLNDDAGQNIELTEARRRLTSNESDDIEASLPALSGTEISRKIMRQALGDLEALRGNLQNSDVEERIVIIYNNIIDNLLNEAAYNLTDYSIPPSEIKHHETRYPRSRRIGRYGGEPAHTEYSEKRYCDRQRFRTAIDSVISRIKLELSSQ